MSGPTGAPGSAALSRGEPLAALRDCSEPGVACVEASVGALLLLSSEKAETPERSTRTCSGVTSAGAGTGSACAGGPVGVAAGPLAAVCGGVAGPLGGVAGRLGAARPAGLSSAGSPCAGLPAGRRSLRNMWFRATSRAETERMSVARLRTSGGGDGASSVGGA